MENSIYRLDIKFITKNSLKKVYISKVVIEDYFNIRLDITI